jgi:spermidine synthase
MMDTTEPAAQVQTRFRRLKVVAFLCGAVLMSLEMAGVRVLNVYFGSTIYVWGAIIGIFLGALSLGYYTGGIIADRWPRFPVLGGIIFAAAVLIMLVPVLARPLCEALGAADGLGPRTQALFSSLLLYFVPSVALGMVSPFAVKLAARDLSDIGRVAGRLYALSTLGSIAGTFLTSFVLVELLGTRNIILLLGAVLVGCSALSLDRMARRAVPVAVGVLLVFGAWLATRPGETVSIHGRKFDRLEEFDSAYHHLLVGEGYYGGGQRARVLFFNHQTQSAMLVDDEGEPVPDARTGGVVSAAGYTDMLHMGMVFRDTVPEKMLIIGCGGGVGPRVFHQDYPQIERIDVVDIDGAAFDMARKYFGFPEPGAHPVIRAHVRDGRLFVREAPTGHYDYIILDAYSAGGRIPFHLITREFLAAVEDALAPGGVVVLNVISGVDGPEGALYRAVTKTLSTVYPNIYAFPRNYLSRGSNIILVCTTDPERLTQNEVRKRLRMQGDRIKREVGPFVFKMADQLPDFGNAPLLTDDYCPTDSMVLK